MSRQKFLIALLFGLGAIFFAGGWVVNQVMLMMVDSSVKDAVKVPTDTSSEEYADYLDDFRPDITPVYRAYTVFNVTNVDDVIYNGVFPIVVERGPYTFRQYERKYPVTNVSLLGEDSPLGVTFSENNAKVTWLSRTEFIFQQDMSIDRITGEQLSADDTFTNIYPQYLGAMAQSGVDQQEDNLLAFGATIAGGVFKKLREARPDLLASDAAMIEQWRSGAAVPEAFRNNTFLATLGFLGGDMTADNGAASNLASPYNLLFPKQPIVPLEFFYFLDYCNIAEAPGRVTGNMYRSQALIKPCDFTGAPSGASAFTFSFNDALKILTNDTFGLWSTDSAVAARGAALWITKDATEISEILGITVSATQAGALKSYILTVGNAVIQHKLDRAGAIVRLEQDPLSVKLQKGSRRWRKAKVVDTIYSQVKDPFLDLFGLATRIGFFHNTTSVNTPSSTSVEVSAVEFNDITTINTGQVNLEDNDKLYVSEGYSVYPQQSNLPKLNPAQFWCGFSLDVEAQNTRYSPTMPPGKRDGLTWSKGLKKDQVVPLFNVDILRSVEFVFDKESDVRGVPTYRYKIADYMFDPAHVFADGQSNNQKYSMELVGVAPLACLKAGLPIMASLPYLRGMTDAQLPIFKLPSQQNPDPNSEFYTYIEMEPNSGALIAGHLKLQLSMAIPQNMYKCTESALYKCSAESNSGLPWNTTFAGRPAIFQPILWAEKRGMLTEDSADKIKNKLIMAIDASFIVLLCGVIVGGVMMIVAVALGIRAWRSGGETGGLTRIDSRADNMS